MHILKGVKFNNVDKEAYAWLQDPNPSWGSANILQSPENWFHMTKYLLCIISKLIF